MASLRDHFRSHTREKPYVCNVCNKKYSFRGSLSLHRRKHSGSRFHCLTCLRNFTQKSTLQYHMLAVHKRVRDNVCGICGLKSFSRATDCRRHMRSHIDSRPYVCTNCSRGFREKCHLLVHQRIHTGEKPFICGQCGFAFSDAANHAKHVRRRSCFFYANNNNNNNNSISGSSTRTNTYTLSGNISGHLRRAYACPTCQRLLSSKAALKAHVQLHNPNKSFACEACGKTFSQRQVLVAHRSNMHSAARVFCETCGALFSNRRSQQRHAMRQHKSANSLAIGSG